MSSTYYSSFLIKLTDKERCHEFSVAFNLYDLRQTGFIEREEVSPFTVTFLEPARFQLTFLSPKTLRVVLIYIYIVERDGNRASSRI